MDGGFAAPLLSIIDDGVGLLLGTTDHDDVPRGARAWGVRVVGDRRLRVVFSADDEIVVANAADGMVAITGAEVRFLRSAQLKGRSVCVDEPNADDLEVAAEQTELFFRAVHETDKNNLDMLRRLLPTRMLAVEIEVCEAFDQTPGPTAGTALGATEAEGSR